MLSLILLALLSPAIASDARPSNPITVCADELIFGVPAAMTQNTTQLCREGYALLHDNSAKIAVWVAWTLLPDDTIGCIPREDAFAPDRDLPPGASADPADYAKSGFDKGHMAPDADMSWSRQTSTESFLMSNMSPQLPNLNRGAWKQLEAQTRAWAWSRKHNLTIYDGNIYSTASAKIGNGVVVPDSLYKIVIDDATGEVLAFRFPNIDKQTTDLKPKLVSVSEIERLTGVVFPLPPGADKSKAAADIWPGGQGDLAEAKRTTCKIKR